MYILHGAHIHGHIYYLICRINQETDGQSELDNTCRKKQSIHEAGE